MPLTVAETRRLVLAMAEAEERRGVRFGWSGWRRAHQAVAARCHTARRARRQAAPALRIITPTPPPPLPAALTDADGDAVKPRLPPQQPPVGRPRHDHRTVLGGMVWVARTQGAWRDMPREFGKWETADKRYRLWRDTGLWQLIVTALGLSEGDDPVEVSL